MGWKLEARSQEPLFYRLLWPRTIFLTFFLSDPRGVVRLALGAAFLRAARFSFFRSALSAIFLVSATVTSFDWVCFTIPPERRAQIRW